METGVETVLQEFLPVTAMHAVCGTTIIINFDGVFIFFSKTGSILFAYLSLQYLHKTRDCSLFATTDTLSAMFHHRVCTGPLV